MMNSLRLLMAGLCLLVANSARAETHVFPINLKAFLTTDGDDTSNTVVRLKFNHRAITASDRLVLVIDDEDNTVNLGIANSSNVVTYVATSTHGAFLASGQFGAILEFTDLTIINDTINRTGTGAVHLKGTFVPDDGTGTARLSKAIILGVFNDNVEGNPTEPNALIKGDITAAGLEYDLDNVTLP